jgi:Immunity protein 32
MVSIHADVRGLGVLIDSLQRIKAKVEANVCEHDHLMSASWGGRELSEVKGCETGELVHHVKIYVWTPEWIAKHKFKT